MRQPIGTDVKSDPAYLAERKKEQTYQSRQWHGAYNQCQLVELPKLEQDYKQWLFWCAQDFGMRKRNRRS